jgi:glycosyltransferase involved in cell wall biosynthesis
MRVVLGQFNQSGGEYLARLAESLSVEHDVLVVLSERADTRFIDETDTEFDVWYLADTDTQKDLVIQSLDPRAYYSIRKRIVQFDPDVIHVMNDLYINAVLIPLLREYPFFITVHEPNFRNRFAGRGLESIYYHLRFHLNKRIRTYADGVFVHGPSTRQILSEYVRPERIWTVPHGQYTSFSAHSDGTVAEENAVLFFGGLYDGKGVEYFIQAQREVTEQLDDVTFIIAGDGDMNRYREYIRDLEYFEIHNQYISDKKACELFERAAIVICPYTEGTQSGVIASAYPFGKPVIATTVGNLPTQVDHGRTGYLVPPRDSQALAKRIVELLSDEAKREAMGASAREKATTELSWDRIAKISTEAYLTIIQSESY